MTKEEYAKSSVDTDYDEYQDWVVSNYDVADIDDEVFENAINDAIYEGYMAHLYQDEEDNDDTWLVDDYQVLVSDIKFEIRKRLKVD
ncbi:hypothetical protein [Xylanibacter ruminicola]|uniref:hypothetical protein n=1 Tax=Xylanibacter ruminicola TaxID=839 RepID=UPI00048DDCEE|nr:hypothetical protein [Xylanibacter ruminicola]